MHLRAAVPEPGSCGRDGSPGNLGAMSPFSASLLLRIALLVGAAFTVGALLPRDPVWVRLAVLAAAIALSAALAAVRWPTGPWFPRAVLHAWAGACIGVALALVVPFAVGLARGGAPLVPTQLARQAPIFLGVMLPVMALVVVVVGLPARRLLGPRLLARSAGGPPAP